MTTKKVSGIAVDATSGASPNQGAHLSFLQRVGIPKCEHQESFSLFSHWVLGVCVKTTIERKRLSKHHQNSSRVAAGYESPARKVPGEVKQIRESRRDDTRSHAYSLRSLRPLAFASAGDVKTPPCKYEDRREYVDGRNVHQLFSS